MVKLNIPVESPLDLYLESIWDTRIEWSLHVAALAYVNEVTWDGFVTVVTFETEEQKNWFLLKFS